MQIRERQSEGAGLAHGMRGLVVALGTCFSMTPAVNASDVNATGREPIASPPLWLASLSSPLHATASVTEPTSPAVRADQPVTLGSSSSSVKQLAARVLANRYPCAAVALTLFDPPQTRDSRWYFMLDGAPTPATAALIASNADPRQIEESIRELGSTPYDPDSRLEVSMRIVTQPLASDASISTVECQVVDANGVSLQTLEPSVRFVWNTKGARLLGLYEETRVPLGPATVRVK